MSKDILNKEGVTLLIDRASNVVSVQLVPDTRSIYWGQVYGDEAHYTKELEQIVSNKERLINMFNIKEAN